MITPKGDCIPIPNHGLSLATFKCCYHYLVSEESKQLNPCDRGGNGAEQNQDGVARLSNYNCAKKVSRLKLLSLEQRGTFD